MKKNEEQTLISQDHIYQMIYFIRGHKVVIDGDLAKLYGVKTKVLLQSVKRNIERFPEDFMFQLSKEELENWRSQFVTSNSASKMGLRRKPYAFTEQGVAMLSSVLRSSTAIKVNIQIMRSFVQFRSMMVTQSLLTKDLEELKSFFLKHSQDNNQEFKKVWKAIDEIANPPYQPNERRIGFDLS